ncbi:MAG: cyclic nucleotide-binding domain-containing protein [Pseudomonadota bacterium]
MEKTDGPSSVMSGLADNMGEAPHTRVLKYSPGQLIIKEGDFGIALYRILKGSVRVLKELESGNVLLFELGPGDIFGEMVFIDGGRSPRTASIEAIENVEVEAWHHLAVWHEYQAANPIIRLMAADMVKKLARINAVHDRLSIDKKPRPQAPGQPISHPAPEIKDVTQLTVKQPSSAFRLADEWSSGREWEGVVEYRILNAPGAHLLKGTGIDLDREGLRIDVSFANMSQGGHEPGSMIEMLLHLPGQDPLQVYGEIKSLSRGIFPGHTAFRINYQKLTPELIKKLDKFLKG